MKKNTLFPLCAALSLLLSPAVHADEADLKNTFIKSGKLTLPDVPPYILYKDQFEDGTLIDGETHIYYQLPAEILSIRKETENTSEDEFMFTYDTILNSCGIQVDVRFDDGNWLSDTGNWNVLDYGEYDNFADQVYMIYDQFSVSEPALVRSFDQSWLSFFNKDEQEDMFYTPYIKEETDEYDQSYFVYNLDEHAVKLRLRYYLTYFINNYDGEYDTEYDGNIIFSDWTQEFSLADHHLNTNYSHSRIESPEISDFSFIKCENDNNIVQFYIRIPKTVREDMMYQASEFIADPYYIETQVRTDGGDWEYIYPDDSYYVTDSYQTAEYTGEVESGSIISLRTRLVRWDGEYSEWSDITSSRSETADEYIEKHSDTAAPGALTYDKIINYPAFSEEAADEKIPVVSNSENPVSGTSKNNKTAYANSDTSNADQKSPTTEQSVTEISDNTQISEDIPELRNNNNNFIIVISVILLAAAAAMLYIFKFRNKKK